MTHPLRSTDPSHIGDYELLSRIGGGGTGEVFLGRSPGGRLAAVKVVRDVVADDPLFRERFRREVEAARSVSGAYTAAVLGSDPDAERPWLATAYIDGPSLLDRVGDEGPLSAQETRRLGAGLAEALRDIHRAGLVHRDLTPSNVLLAADGPRLIGFGIIRAEDADGDGLTGSGSGAAAGDMLASAGYLAPEQAAGGEATAASDVYSLGSVLTFAATGHGPFGTGSAPEVLLRQASGDRDISAIPEGLRDVVARCLDILPGARPTTDSLLELLGGSAIADEDAATPTAPERPRTGKATKSSKTTEAPKAAKSPKTAKTPKAPKNSQKTNRTQPQRRPKPQPTPARRKVLFLGIVGAVITAFWVGVANMPHGDIKTTGGENKDADSGTDKGGLPTTKTTGLLGGPLKNPDWTGKVPGQADLLAVSGSTLLVHGLGLTALDTATGTQRWTVGTGEYVDFDDGSLPVVAGTVYESALDTGDLVAIDVASGKETWHVPEPAGWLSYGLIGGSPGVTVGWSYTDSSASSNSTAKGLWAIDTHLRQPLWHVPISDPDGAPYYSAGTDQILLSQPNDYQLTAYDAKSGRQAWTAKDTSDHSSGSAFATAIANHGTTVYWATSRLYAFDQHGQPLWPVGVSEGGDDLFHAVVADADTVYVAAEFGLDGSVVAAYKASDGAPLWRAAWPHDNENFLSSSVDCELTLGAGNLYIADHTTGTLIAVDAKTGETRWQYHDPAAAKEDYWSIAADDHYVFVGYGTTVRGFKAV